MFEVVDFIYNNVERKVLVDKTDSDGDIYGFDLNLLSETERDIVFDALNIIQNNAKSSYRHFKKQKIKTNNNVEKIEEKQKKFSI